MNWVCKDDAVIFSSDSFNISEILECGQCFRFTKVSANEYLLIAYERVLHIKQESCEITLYPCSEEDFINIWIPYFDLNRDYRLIKEELSQDPILEKAIMFADGIRILNQEKWECLISFIISQNMNIPRIKTIIKTLCEKYGTPISDYYSFPNIQQLKDVTLQELVECKTGFRAKYIIDAIHKAHTGELDVSQFTKISTEELRKTLLSVYGVGNKVSDCVMLFSCGRHEVFPTDVWVKRIMQKLYFKGEDIPIKEIHKFAQDKFKENAGFAQQYLFHFARQTKI